MVLTMRSFSLHDYKGAVVIVWHPPANTWLHSAFHVQRFRPIQDHAAAFDDNSEEFPPRWVFHLVVHLYI